MVNQKILKSFLVCLVMTVCCLTVATATSGQAYAATASPAHAANVNSCTYWSTDVETYFPYRGQTLSGGSTTYYWDISISSFRACGTGHYLGKAADKVCLTVPSGTGWPTVRIYNQWYTDGHFISGQLGDPFEKRTHAMRNEFSSSVFARTPLLC